MYFQSSVQELQNQLSLPKKIGFGQRTPLPTDVLQGHLILTFRMTDKVQGPDPAKTYGCAELYGTWAQSNALSFQ